MAWLICGAATDWCYRVRTTVGSVDCASLHPPYVERLSRTYVIRNSCANLAHTYNGRGQTQIGDSIAARSLPPKIWHKQLRTSEQAGRVGSTNRRADREMIDELRRCARGVGFDEQALPE